MSERPKAQVSVVEVVKSEDLEGATDNGRWFYMKGTSSSSEDTMRALCGAMFGVADRLDEARDVEEGMDDGLKMPVAIIPKHVRDEGGTGSDVIVGFATTMRLSGGNFDKHVRDLRDAGFVKVGWISEAVDDQSGA